MHSKYFGLSEKMKIQLYKAYIRTIILYADPVWVKVAEYLLKRLTMIETKALRVINNFKPLEISNKELYEKANIEPVLFIHLSPN